jgi:hypothetical protein
MLCPFRHASTAKRVKITNQKQCPAPNQQIQTLRGNIAAKELRIPPDNWTECHRSRKLFVAKNFAEFPNFARHRKESLEPSPEEVRTAVPQQIPNNLPNPFEDLKSYR